MIRYAGIRILQTIPLLFGVVLLAFVLLELTPGDPITALVGDYPVPPEQRALLTEKYRLDDPFLVRFFTYIANLATGDFGYSFASNRPVGELLLDRFPNTLLLAVPAMVLAAALGSALGAWSATSRRRGVDGGITLFALSGFSIPAFWLAQILVLVFSLKAGWLPVQGRSAIIPPPDTGAIDAIWNSGKYFILPVLALTAQEAGLMARITRASMLETLGEDYILTARSKGLTHHRINVRHALRNCLLPLTSVAGYRFGHALGGTILIETIFAWPGMGRLLYEAIEARDHALIVGALVLSATVVLVVNLLTDITYGLLDPRVRRR